MCEQTDTSKECKESGAAEPQQKVECSRQSTPSLKVYKKPRQEEEVEEPSWAKPLSYFELKRRMKEVKEKEKYYPKPRPLGKVRVL